MLDRNIYNAIFSGLQAHFIVEDLCIYLCSHPNGHYDIPTMVKGNTIPPAQAIQWDIRASVYERPLVVKEGVIKSKKYVLTCSPFDKIKPAEIVMALIDNCKEQKQRHKEQLP